MKKSFQFLFLALLISTSSFSQSVDADTDAKYFFSVVAGFNSVQLHSSGPIFEDTKFNSGYSIGLQFNLFPDYEFQQFYTRAAIYYSKERSENETPVVIQGEPVRAKGDFSFANIEAFIAYRFAKQATVDVYLGAGFLFQQKITKDDDAYRFIDTDGNEFPIFDRENLSLPLRFQSEGPKAALGPFAELGAFVPVGNKLLGISTGVQYSYFKTNSSAKLNFEKTTLYLRASYELF
tara:strand:+ start:782 stop:1486 length:705 start_codon:yes stop_codon:yes gene_type:complete